MNWAPCLLLCDLLLQLMRANTSFGGGDSKGRSQRQRYRQPWREHQQQQQSNSHRRQHAFFRSGSTSSETAQGKLVAKQMRHCIRLWWLLCCTWTTPSHAAENADSLTDYLYHAASCNPAQCAALQIEALPSTQRSDRLVVETCSVIGERSSWHSS